MTVAEISPCAIQKSDVGCQLFKYRQLTGSVFSFLSNLKISLG